MIRIRIWICTELSVFPAKFPPGRLLHWQKTDSFQICVVNEVCLVGCWSHAPTAEHSANFDTPTQNVYERKSDFYVYFCSRSYYFLITKKSAFTIQVMIFCNFPRGGPKTRKKSSVELWQFSLEFKKIGFGLLLPISKTYLRSDKIRNVRWPPS